MAYAKKRTGLDDEADALDYRETLGHTWIEKRRRSRWPARSCLGFNKYGAPRLCRQRNREWNGCIVTLWHAEQFCDRELKVYTAAVVIVPVGGNRKRPRAVMVAG